MMWNRKFSAKAEVLLDYVKQAREALFKAVATREKRTLSEFNSTATEV